MNTALLILCLLNLALIGALPRIFFRPGRLNVHWWLTAAPFFVTALLLLAAIGGLVSPSLPGAERALPLQSLAVLLSVCSILLIGFTLGTHEEPLALWHQEDDAPVRLVTHGAYALVRHPFYLAFLLALCGCLAAFPHWITAATLLYACVQLNRTAAREERRLLDSDFGREYASYSARTGRLFPRVGGGRGMAGVGG